MEIVHFYGRNGAAPSRRPRKNGRRRGCDSTSLINFDCAPRPKECRLNNQLYVFEVVLCSERREIRLRRRDISRKGRGFLALAQLIRNFLSAYFDVFRRREITREPGASDYEHRSTHMTKVFSRFIKDESGATAIEYGLIASLVSIAAIVAFNSVGSKLKSTFNDIANNLSS
jgi:pilus assembly protein Flp/PilA